MRIAAFQTAPLLGQVDTNREGILAGISAADADLAVFPECALTGYAFSSKAEALAVAETIPGKTTGLVADLCRSTGGHALFGMLERDGDHLWNAAALVGPDGLIGKYQKAHLLHLGVDRFTEPGSVGLPVFDTKIGRIGVLICFDLSFPEAARVLKLKGAQVLCVPTNWPMEAEVSCEHAPFARAQENHLHMVCVNRAGEEGGFTFRGSSRVLDCDAKVLAHAGAGVEVLRAELDPKTADRNHIIYRPGEYELDRIGSRRPELYDALVAPVAPNAPGVPGRPLTTDP